MTKRKIPTPAVLTVETIWWHDAASVEREKISTEPVVMMQSGFVVFENAIEIGLAHSIESQDDWNTDNHEGWKIPRGMVIKRAVHGEVPVVPPEVAAYKERVNEPSS